MGDIEALIATTVETKRQFNKLIAAVKAVSKKQCEAGEAFRAQCKLLHHEIGALPNHSLATNLERSRYYEVQHAQGDDRYIVKSVQRTGKYGDLKHYPRQIKLAGSLLPVTNPDDPVYVKWQKQRVCAALEGKPTDDIIF